MLIALAEPSDLRQHVVDAGALQHGAHRATGDDAGTGRGRTQQDDARGLLTLDRVRDGALDAGHLEEVLLGLLDALGDRRGHLLGLAVADADRAVAVADDDQRGEAEATATLDDLGDAVDRHDALDVGALLGAASRRSSRRSRRSPTGAATAARAAPSAAPASTLRSAIGSSWFVDPAVTELQPALAGAVGHRGDAAVVAVAAAVEDDRVDAGRLGALGDELADLLGLGGLVAVEPRAGRPPWWTRDASVWPCGVVDDLRRRCAARSG